MKPVVITATIRDAFIALAIVLPWLNPFASGPSPAVLPWLVALAATAGLMLLRTTSTNTHGDSSFAQRWACPAAWALAGVASSVIGLLQYFGAVKL